MNNELNQNNNKNKTIIHPSINGILGIISFSTRIPVNRYITIEEMAGSVITWPFIGLAIGCVGAIVTFLLKDALHLTPILIATLIYCFLIWFTGFNHLDGVLDMGDGLMAHGDAQRRLEIMRDSMVGTGGIATFFIVASITIAALSSINSQHIIYVVLLMEMYSKLAMITTFLLGDDDSKGIGREIKIGMDYKVLLIDSVIVAIIGYVFLGIPGIIATIAAVCTGFAMSIMAQRNFGCVTGDIMGATNEIARVVSLIFIIISFNLII